MKIYTVFYNECTGDINYVLIMAKNERRARNEFIHIYGYSNKIIEIEGANL